MSDKSDNNKKGGGTFAADQTKKVTSITRRLYLRQILGKLGICITMDVLAFFASSAAYFCGIEMAEAGKLLRKCQRELIPAGKSLMYVVSDKAGVQLISHDALPFIRSAAVIAGVLLIIQLVITLLGIRGENRKIRQILSPINEMALKADELSRMSFSEDKYHLMEDAIEQIDPEGAQTLSFGDSDLSGVEAAMNNLLIRMRETNRQQARFVNDAAHELRTPIAVLQGYANMLDRWGKDDEKILDESITAIRHESDHMNHLVEQLLFLARGDSGRTAVKKEAIDLTAMMREVYEESFMIDEKHPYRFRPSEEGITAFADPGLLKQAVRILIDNAAKYTHEGDEILLGCGRAEGGVYAEVQDTGIGMAEADVKHMFERFYRSDEVRSYQGTGLGLSIAKWIVDKHKGHFEILSRTGLGTRIRIVLPENGA